MELQLNNNNGDVSITLKEITDLLDVRHNNAIRTVDKLAEDPSFGVLLKMSTFNLNGVKVKTYLLDKRQAIIVAARLNDRLLIKVVDKIYELEAVNSKLIIENAKQQTKIFELQLKEKEQQLIAKDIEREQAVAEAKRMNDYDGFISVSKYVKENNKSVSKDIVWDALIWARYVHGIIRSTKYRRLNGDVDVTQGKLIKGTQTPVFTIEVLDTIVSAYSKHMQEQGL